MSRAPRSAASSALFRTISHGAANRLGWYRLDARPWRKTSARWGHVSGYQLTHCGHPTALYPWQLFHPDGHEVGTGALKGKPRTGNSWANLAQPMIYVHGLAPSPRYRIHVGAGGEVHVEDLDAAPVTVAVHERGGERMEVRVGRLEQLELFAGGAA